MKDLYLFAGSFCPPTYGHFEVVKKFFRQRKKDDIKPKLIIVCSPNPKKLQTRWFDEKESKRLWRYYDLPSNTAVLTYEELMKSRYYRRREIHLIRGLRAGEDYSKEFKISLLDNDNERRELLLNEVTHVFTNPEFAYISSSRVRELICQRDYKEVKKYVPAAMISFLAKRCQGIST